MKKTLLFLTALLCSSLSLISVVHAEGEVEDNSVYCSSVNDQKHKDVPAESTPADQGQSGEAAGST